MEYKSLKRYLDIIFSTLGLIVLLPLFIFIGISIKLDSKGPIIYKQSRLGRRGKIFTMYKFRTMYLGGESQGVYELKGDRRVSKIGKVLRTTSIDELPQLINILKGDMSFIGPRPSLTFHPWAFSQYTVAEKKRFTVVPGITGLAQIHGRKDLEWDKRIEYDIEYINNMSLLQDIKILISTVFKVFSMKSNLNVKETAKKRNQNKSLKLMYITNDKKIAKIAESSGVDWIFIDLEVIGKKHRQGHLDTVISHHKIEDVKEIKENIRKAKLIVRVNPIYDGSKEEIDKVIEAGADFIMLPFFRTKKEVEQFIHFTNGKVKTCLLVETPEAVDNIDDILSVPGIDYLYIGLNDLHIGYERTFMFSLLADGSVEKLCDKFRAKGIPYGFGGIARLKHGQLPAEYIIREFYRLGSSMVILSRSFCNASKEDNYHTIENVFKKGVKEIRSFEEYIKGKDYLYFLKSQKILKKKVSEIENQIEENMEKGRKVI